MQIMQAVSWLGNEPQMFLLITAFVLGLLVLKLRQEAFFLAVSGIGSYLISSSLKILVHEPRPPLSVLTDGSFPSGHVLSFVACFGFLAYLARRRKTLSLFFIGLIVLIGPSRIYLGDHWINDVLAAYFLGGVWLILVVHFYKFVNLKAK